MKDGNRLFSERMVTNAESRLSASERSRNLEPVTLLRTSASNFSSKSAILKSGEDSEKQHDHNGIDRDTLSRLPTNLRFFRTYMHWWRPPVTEICAVCPVNVEKNSS